MWGAFTNKRPFSRCDLLLSRWQRRTKNLTHSNFRLRADCRLWLLKLGFQSRIAALSELKRQSKLFLGIGTMPSFEFACPHCSWRFRLENRATNELVACPKCGQSLAIRDELPATRSEETASGDDVGESSALDFIQPTLSIGTGRTSRKVRIEMSAKELNADEAVENTAGRPAEKRAVRTLSREEKTRRRQRRSTILMAGGLALLIIALLLLSRM